MMFLTAHLGDEIEPWGRNIKARDRQLRESITIEPLFNSALGTVCSRNATFSWKLDGPEEDTTRLQEVLQNAEFGAGWAEFILKLSIDLYTQDSGAFFEIIREKDAPDSRVVGIANLDAARCYPTGNPEEPVWYVDRNGEYHRMKWYQVVHILEVPAAYETMPGLQYCAYTRLLIQAQIMRDTEIYTKEKVGGRNPRAITLIQGVKAADVMAAVQSAAVMNDSMGRLRYSNPIMVSSADPNATVDFKTLEVASLPDGFDADLNQKQYLTILALAFMTDYQEFAPLPGGGLGTGSQSEVLDKKSRGKGPGLFMKLVMQAINFRVLPKDVQFSWDEQDIQEDKIVAEVREIRANYRKVMLESGQITIEVAWMMMLEDGDLTQEQYDLLLKQQEEKRLAEEAAAADAEAMAAEMGTGAPGGGATTPEEETAGQAPKFPTGPVMPEETKALTEEELKWSEAYQLRDAKGQFAGTVGSKPKGGKSGGAAAADESIAPSQGYPVDENGDPIPSDESKMLARAAVAHAQKNEAAVTADIQNVVTERHGAELAGLDYRVKGESSTARKIESDSVNDHVSRKEAAAKLGDSIRFTAILSPEEYTVKSQNIMRDMERNGFQMTKTKNYWVDGNGSYRGLNTNAVHTKTGMTIELQFHTAASFHMKENVNHPIYEEARKLSTPEPRKQLLTARMVSNFKGVERPANVETIPTNTKIASR